MEINRKIVTKSIIFLLVLYTLQLSGITGAHTALYSNVVNDFPVSSINVSAPVSPDAVHSLQSTLVHTFLHQDIYFSSAKNCLGIPKPENVILPDVQYANDVGLQDAGNNTQQTYALSQILNSSCAQISMNRIIQTAYAQGYLAVNNSADTRIIRVDYNNLYYAFAEGRNNVALADISFPAMNENTSKIIRENLSDNAIAFVGFHNTLVIANKFNFQILRC